MRTGKHVHEVEIEPYDFGRPEDKVIRSRMKKHVQRRRWCKALEDEVDELRRLHKSMELDTAILMIFYSLLPPWAEEDVPVEGLPFAAARILEKAILWVKRMEERPWEVMGADPMVYWHEQVMKELTK